MSYKIYKYIQTHFSQQPDYVDKLIVSAFFKKNNLVVNKNKFLKKYLIKDSDIDASKKLKEFINIIDQYFDKVDIETMIELFEFVISPADRVVTGAVYTPREIREQIVQNIFNNQLNIGAEWQGCDIASGCGGFLYTMAKCLKSRLNRPYAVIFERHLFGLDIMPYSIKRSRILLTTLAIMEGEDNESFKFNLYSGDALNFQWSKKILNFNGFDCIVGNPPYVCSRKIGKKTKELLGKLEVCSSGHPDLYIPFFQIGMELLKPNGYLGYITMNSFFKSLNGRALRNYFHNKRYAITILDFGTLQVFRKRSTYTCICVIQNQNADSVEYRRVDTMANLDLNTLAFNKIPYESLKAHNGWNLSSFDLIDKIEATGTPFSVKYKTRNGIATLKNEIYIFKPAKENGEYYFLQNGSLFQIEKSICKDILNPNLLTKKGDLNDLTEKIIFPYEYMDGKVQVLSEAKLSREFPFAHKYLKSKRSILETRDNGKGQYPKWFAFGRTQSLEQMRFKLFFPHITPHTPHFILNSDENLFFYNGIAVVGGSIKELLCLKKLMSSRLFWFYLKNTSKPYTSGYYSMSKNYIKDFGVYEFTKSDIEFILQEENQDSLDRFFEERYGVNLDD